MPLPSNGTASEHRPVSFAQPRVSLVYQRRTSTPWSDSIQSRYHVAPRAGARPSRRGVGRASIVPTPSYTTDTLAGAAGVSVKNTDPALQGPYPSSA